MGKRVSHRSLEKEHNKPHEKDSEAECLNTPKNQPKKPDDNGSMPPKC